MTPTADRHSNDSLRMDMPEKLWDFSNIITGFSIAQSVAFSYALGDGLKFIHCWKTGKVGLSIIIIIFSFGYSCAIWQCCRHGGSLDNPLNREMWRITKWWRLITLTLFSAFSIAALFAPEIVALKNKESPRPNCNCIQ
jgi:hypothetical protein